MSVLDQETTETYRERAAQAHAATLAAWNDEFGGGTAAALDAGVSGMHGATGSVTLATAFIWGTVVAQLRFDDGTSMEFNGKHWGVGLGGGIVWGAGVFNVNPSELTGWGTYTVGTGGGTLNITFYKNDLPVGTFAGAGLSVGPAVVGGSGEWRRS
ncbi:MAG TPA: hypothetical protein VGB24_13130 [Longimicrobium sp.]|jgi:hypothetical protein|uniref:hypothetical protein n=1 Tax=Longimicrobium sp. TaxID=2029185 RepID=UPI002ED86F3D